MKAVEIKLRRKINGEILTFYCHHYIFDGENYILSGVKGLSKYGECVYFNKIHYERVK